MAQNATIYKVELQIADMDRHYYQRHALTIARHPSETDERMMVRVLAFALHASDALSFTKGLCADDEPDLWQKDLTGAIDLWIDVGQPDERRVRKACTRANRVFIYNYGSRTIGAWWADISRNPARVHNLTVVDLPAAGSKALAGLAQRSMQLQCTIQDGQVWIADHDRAVPVDLTMRTVTSTGG